MNTGNDKPTEGAHGGYRRAHYGRDEGTLRGGNGNPAGKAEWLSPKRTKQRGREVHPTGVKAAQAGKRLTLPAPATHFVTRRGEERAQPGWKARPASRNTPASSSA